MQTYIQAGKASGATDAEQIQNAIAEAKSNGTNRVVISRHNDRTGADIWNINSVESVALEYGFSAGRY